MIKIIMFVFIFISLNSYSQNLILNPGFEIGWQFNSSYDGQPGVLNTNNCNYSNANYFDNEVSHWRVADHNNEKGVKDPSWITITCENNHITTCTYNNFFPSGNQVLISADIYKCKENNWGNIKVKLFHEAIRIGLTSQLTNDKEYIIRYKLLSTKSILEKLGVLQPLDWYCDPYITTSRMRVFFSEYGQHWDTPSSDIFETNNTNVTINFSTPCKWNYIERSFSVPSYGIYKNLILYMQDGAFMVDDVELFEKCTEFHLIQNKVYANQYEMNIEAGSYFESASNYINAGNDVGATNVLNGDVVIHNGANVEFSAGNRILLKPGFKTEPGAHFIAKIEPCNGNKINYEEFSDNYLSSITDNLKNGNIDTLAENVSDDITFKNFFNIFPNPAKNNINIEIKCNFINCFNVSIINILGTTVKQIKCFDKNILCIDVSDLQSGIYSIVINYENQLLKKELIIL